VEFDTVLAAIERARNITDLSFILNEWRNHSGLAHIIYRATSVPTCDKQNPVLLATCGEALMRHHLEESNARPDGAFLDGHAFLPVDWMTLDRTTSTDRRHFVEAESGIGRQGLTLQIRGPYGERALFTIVSNDADHQWYRWRYLHLRDFHLVAHYLHDRAMKIAGLRSIPGMRPLSRRERQSLQGVADGRTPQQIAESLAISASAVHLYLRSARRKLNSATIAQAVGKAICLELIGINKIN